MKLEILALAAHPDDVELACGGTILNTVNSGKRCGIVDLTQGELGTRGTIDTRYEEAAEASKVLGVAARENLQMADGFFSVSTQNLLKVVEQIRLFRPEIVLTNSTTDRHPDHGRAGDLVEQACFLAGLPKVETSYQGVWQDAWRPKKVYRFVQDRYIKPDFIVDISDSFEAKMEAVKCFKTQFYNPESKEPNTPISGENFLKFLEARAREFGRLIGVEYGEGYTSATPVGVKSLDVLL